MRLSNAEKITSAILPLARNILYTPLYFRLFSNSFSVTMLALLLRISSKMQVQNCGTYSFNITKAVKYIYNYGNRDVFRRVAVCRLLPTFLPLSADSFLMPLSERPPAFDRVSSHVRSRLVPRSVVPRPAFADKYRDCNKKPYLPPVLIRAAGLLFFLFCKLLYEILLTDDGDVQFVCLFVF